jgi:Tfp pilus assembly protein PilO
VTLTKRDKILLVALVVVGLVGGLWWFVVKPAQADVTARTEEVRALEDETGAIRDQITRLEQQEGGEVAQSIEGFRLAKAVPDRGQIPGAILQMQRMAENSDVTLSAIRTTATTDYGPFSATELDVTVNGRFFDVDDFMYRMHRQVTIDDKDQPRISGRLFAIKSFDLELDEASGDEDSDTPRDSVEGTLKVLVFSAPVSATTPAAASAAAAPTTTGGTP